MMSNPALVVVACRIAPSRIQDFLRWNQDILATMPCFFVTEVQLLRCPCPSLTYPQPLPVFSLAKTANYGIRHAVEAGHDPIIKTDIDVAFDGLDWLSRITAETAVVPRYTNSPSFQFRRCNQGFLPNGQGTVGMTAANWARVEGYDERCTGYGGEDNELMQQLAKRQIAAYRDPIVWHIAHIRKWGGDFNPSRGKLNIGLPARGAQPNWGRGC